MSGPAVDGSERETVFGQASRRAIDLEGFAPRRDLHGEEAARYALAAVIAHAERVHAPSGALQDSVAELLTDLMHLVERAGSPFEDVLEAARDAYWLDLAGALDPAS